MDGTALTILYCMADESCVMETAKSLLQGAFRAGVSLGCPVGVRAFQALLLLPDRPRCRFAKPYQVPPPSRIETRSSAVCMVRLP